MKEKEKWNENFNVVYLYQNFDFLNLALHTQTDKF